MVFHGTNSFDFIFVGALKYSRVITLHSAYIPQTRSLGVIMQGGKASQPPRKDTIKSVTARHLSSFRHGKGDFICKVTSLYFTVQIPSLYQVIINSTKHVLHEMVNKQVCVYTRTFISMQQ